MSDAYTCPNCSTAIRATGGSERLYYTDDQKNEVVKHDLDVFSRFNVDDEFDYLHYCPNQDCRVWRLLPGDDDE